MGVHLKNSVFRRVHEGKGKGNCLKGGIGQFADLRGGLAKKMGGSVFEGFDTPIHIMGKVGWF